MENNWKIETQLPVSYDIKTSDDIFWKENLDLLSYGEREPECRRLVVIDRNVNHLYGHEIVSYLDHHKVDYKIVLLNGGESEKNLENLIYLLEEIEKFGLSRRSEPIIGIGGGVVLDLVGMAAGMYRRGVPYMRVPTTLLGIVDVSVAAKTGINFQNRRNRLGSYYPPIATLLDKRFISTQDWIEISSGMGEILKMAVVKDKILFDIIEKHGDELLEKKFVHSLADEVINRSVKGMIEELENNLWEKDLKRLVDFGHSFSPIIEMRSLGTPEELTHGQAVAIDVLFSCVISYIRNLLSEEDVHRVFDAARMMQLPTYHSSFVDPHLLLESLSDTMKHRNGAQNLPVPQEIGKSIFISDLSYDEIVKATTLFKNFSQFSWRK